MHSLKAASLTTRGRLDDGCLAAASRWIYRVEGYRRVYFGQHSIGGPETAEGAHRSGVALPPRKGSRKTMDSTCKTAVLQPSLSWLQEISQGNGHVDTFPLITTRRSTDACQVAGRATYTSEASSSLDFARYRCWVAWSRRVPRPLASFSPRSFIPHPRAQQGEASPQKYSFQSLTH